MRRKAPERNWSILLCEVNKIFVFLSVALDVNGRFGFKFDLYWRGFGVERCPFLKYIFPHFKLSELVLIECLHEVPLVDLHVAAGLAGHGDPPLARNTWVPVLCKVDPVLGHLFRHFPAIKCGENMKYSSILRSHIISHILLEECPRRHESVECKRILNGLDKSFFIVHIKLWASGHI